LFIKIFPYFLPNKKPATFHASVKNITTANTIKKFIPHNTPPTIKIIVCPGKRLPNIGIDSPKVDKANITQFRHHKFKTACFKYSINQDIISGRKKAMKTKPKIKT